MSKKLILTCALTAATAMASMATTPLWMRYAQISPDGKEIVFAYKGDLYKVSSKGGQAVQLTSQPSYECNPVWSPDGKTIAFASDRKGNFDVYVMPAEGGQPKQLTFNSASEVPTTFTADGKGVVFGAAIQDPAASMSFPTSRQPELYSVPVDGGRAKQIIATPAEDVKFSPKGDFMLFHDQKGFEDALRKHHTSSVTRDIWRYDVASGKFTNLTNRAGEDRSPVLAPDGNTVYFLSERNGGSFNVWKFGLNNPQNATQVSTFTKNPVRFLSMANDGTLCYTQNGELYTQIDGGQPQKVQVTLYHDDSDQVTNLTMTSGASEAVPSPDGKQVAFIVRGDVFVTSVEYGTTKQVSNTPQAESDVCWGPDNRTLIYASERNGNWQLVKATIGRKDDPNFPNATTIKEEVVLPSSTVERYQPAYSPDGKEIAFVEDRSKLKVLNVASGAVREVTDGSMWFGSTGKFEYKWSPDGKWFALQIIGNGRDPYSDIGIVSAQGGKVTNITGSAYISEQPRWTFDGNAITWLSNRYGMRSQASWGSQSDVLMAFVNEDAYDKYRLSKEDYELRKELDKKANADKPGASDKKKDKKDNKKKDDKKKDEESKPKTIDVQLDGICDRVVRVTPNSSDIASATFSKDGDNLYYLSAFEGGYDLWKMDLREHSTKLINKLNSRWAALEQDKDGKNIFVLGASKMGKLAVTGDKYTPISYKAQMKLNLADEREYELEHVHRQIAKKFYNLNMHGCDWDAVVANYKQFLPHISNNYDFANLLSEALGELNASHTGGRYYPTSRSEATANLGLLFDQQYAGNGLKVDEVVEYGPFDRAKSQVRKGTVVEKINGTDITIENDYTTLLNGTGGKKTLVSLYNPATGKRWEEVVLPVTASEWNGILYKRWVKRCAQLVDSLSGGRLGYVHLQQMNDKSYREVYSQVLGKYNKRDGIVIDTRWNGGGRLHEDIEILFSGQKYFTQVVRGREACDMPSRRWNKPSIMVQCEANYSNAHGTPWVYKHQHLGKLVGKPVPGTMTSVSWETLQDPSMIFGIPIIGYELPDGSYLENSQLDPDIDVTNNPAELAKGRDAQLETAVKELLREIDAKK